MNTYIVILTWNNVVDFRLCVESIGANTLSACKLILIENGSRPEERAEIKRIYDRLYDVPWACLDTGHYYEAAFNEGIPAGQNRALAWLAEHETEPYGVVLLDADTVVEMDWLTKILAYAEAHPDVGIVGSAKSPGSPSHPVYHHTNGRWYVHDKQGQDPARDFMEGESVDFACAYLRPELLARGLRMDERYKIYDGYDQDMTFRVRSWGYRIVQIDAGVVHFGSAAMKANNYQWSGGGHHEWSELRAKNVKRFATIWAPFLAPRRHSVKDEVGHMAAMNAKLFAEAGERSQIPGRGKEVP